MRFCRKGLFQFIHDGVRPIGVATALVLGVAFAQTVSPYQAQQFSGFEQSGYYTIQQASAHADKGELKAAHRLYQTASERLPQSLMGYFSLGETAYNLASKAENKSEKLDYLREAKWSYYRVANLHPDLTLGYYKLAEITWDMADYEEAEAILEEGLEMHPGDLLLHYSMGLTQEKLGNSTAAIDSYQDALRLREGYAPAHASLGILYEESGKMSDAEKHYRAAVTSEPDNSEFQVNLALFLINDGKLEEGEKLVYKALKTDPDNPMVYLALGHIHFDRKQFDSALTYYKQAKELNPDYNAVYYYLSITLEHLNRDDEAIAEGSQYMNLEPSGRYAKEAQALITTLKEKKTSP